MDLSHSRKRGAIFGLALGLIASVSGSPVLAEENEPSRYIEGVRNSEDLVRLEGTDWVIASGRKAPDSADTGRIYLINIKTGVAEAVYPSGVLEAPTHELGASCDSAPDPKNFEAHGLGVSAGLFGKYKLFVVNHAFPSGGREAVELFSVDATGGKPLMTWSDCVIMPKHTSGNDVVALPDGGFAVTNFSDPADGDLIGKLERGENTGNVLEWHRKTGFTPVPGSEMSGPNGIETDYQGRYYFVDAWGSKELIRISRDSNPVERKAARTDVYPDNNAWTWDGKLIVVGQVTRIQELFDCIASSKDFCPTAFKALEFDPVTLESKELVFDAHPNMFGGGTSPRPVGDDLWIGSFRAGKIARYSLK